MYMNEIKELYRELKGKKKYTEEAISAKQKQLSELSSKKQSIIIKKIHGELYYYAQWREKGKIESKFLSTVTPGVIAETEKTQLLIDILDREVKELKVNLKELNKMLVYLEKQRKAEKIMDNFTFEVYWKDEITARVYVKGDAVTVSRFTDNPAKQLFAEKKMTRYQLGKIFELRCWERGRADIQDILKYRDLTEYNPYEIVRKTHGVSYNDHIWFRFPGESITSRDVLVR